MHTRTRSEYKSFVIMFIQNPISVSAIAKMCYNYCLMPKPTVEMSFAYKDEIWVQIICWFCLSKTLFLLIALLQSAPYVKMCHYYCLMPTPTVEMSYAYKDEIWVQIICDSFHPKPNFCQCYCQNVSLLDRSTNHLWFCLSKTLLQSAPYVKMCHYYCLMPSPT